jgi:hypothetical protein
MALNTARFVGEHIFAQQLAHSLTSRFQEDIVRRGMFVSLLPNFPFAQSHPISDSRGGVTLAGNLMAFFAIIGGHELVVDLRKLCETASGE